MRQIGSTSDLKQAEKFADHLRAQGVTCSVDQEGQGFRVWVHDDDRVTAAKEELKQFLADPNHPRFQDAEIRAMEKVREDLRRQRAARQNVVHLSERWDRPVWQACPLTLGLIAISIVVAYFTNWDPQQNDPRVSPFWFSIDGTLQPIMHGEVWRLITPIFLHFGPMHLIFNMLWTKQFGFQIEYRVGTFKLLLMVLTIAALSNFFQFWFGGQWFGGMSGVVYGLFGYIWVRGKLEPNTGFDLPQQTITMMLFWHVLCLMGVIPHVANWAHGAGLVAGIAIAFGRSLMKPLLQRQ